MQSKLALGGVQFGLDYGINNAKGKIREAEAEKILLEAQRLGITVIDTAQAYGDSEEALGKIIQRNRLKFSVITKLDDCPPGQVKPSLEASLARLCQQQLYGVLIHHFEFFQKNTAILEQMNKLKQEGKVKKTGFSLYFPHQLEYLMENHIPFDLLQVPYSVFDQRFEKYFSLLREKGTEFHVRSVFLQGLVFKKAGELNSWFQPIAEKITRLQEISRQLNLSIHALCLNFAIANPLIAQVIVGVDSYEQFCKNAEALQYQDKVQESLQMLKALHCDDENIIVPSNWKINA